MVWFLFSGLGGAADLSGTVKKDGIPLNAMVLANGQYLFTNAADGAFNLTGVPLDGNGQITLFAFCDGLTPYKSVLTGGETGIAINLTASPGAPPVVSVLSWEERDDKPGWVTISGTIQNDDGVPLCAMILANGQYLFTCDPVGEYELSVPLDSNDQVTLFGFCDGLMPFRSTFGGEVVPKIPDTGQTTSYTDTFGEDSDYTINPPSYTKLDATGKPLADDVASWAMVQDNRTGLIWENKTDDGGIHDKDNKYTWYDPNSATNGGNQGTPGEGTDTKDFIDALNAAKFGGFSDWRLPTVKELSTIKHSDKWDPSINAAYFQNTQSSYYWSSTTGANNSGYAWYVHFHSGQVTSYYKLISMYARAVRGGQSGVWGDSVISGRMVDNKDGTVTDTKTGLIWQQAEAGLMTTWEDALTYCENLNLANHDDWRMPNINELGSLVDYSKDDPAIDTVAFPDAVSSDYWSSTTPAATSYDAWYVYFRNGYVGDYNEPGSLSVRAVRGGQ
jgi:hypothetical protein